MSDSQLFSPFTVKGVTFRNRFVMPGMQRGFAHDGEPTREMGEIYRERAAAGVSLIVSESSAVPHPSADWRAMFCRVERQTLGGWKRIADTVRGAGANFFIQLWHPGAMREAEPGYRSAHQISLSPSGMMGAGRPNGVAMTRQDLSDVRDAYIEAALIAQAAGANGVEVHACHGYLLDQFLWSVTNRRDDEYGGATAAERARYPAEIVADIRAAVGPEFLISLRFSQFKEIDYGARICETPEELGAMLTVLRGAGVDLFHVSTRRFYRPAWPESPLTLAAWVKSLTDAAVITVGSVGLSTDMLENMFDDRTPAPEVQRSVDALERGVRDNEFDLVAVGRSLIADPAWVTKVREHRFEDIPTFTKSMLGAVLELGDSLTPNDRVITEDG